MKPSTLSRNKRLPNRQSPHSFSNQPDPLFPIKKSDPPFPSGILPDTDTGQSLAALTHEVRNPLTNINLAVEMIRLATKDKELTTYLDIIMRSSTRINGLVTDLLKHKAAGEVQVKKHSMHELVDEVIEMASDRIMLKNISVTKDYAALNDQQVMNRPSMKIALTNIIINAIDAATKGKGNLNVSSSLIRGRYCLHVEDNGCGISKKNLKIIFTPFFTNKPGGLGIGLSTTQDILRANHVTINVESKEGFGTRFILLFEEDKSNDVFN